MWGWREMVRVAVMGGRCSYILYKYSKSSRIHKVEHVIVNNRTKYNNKMLTVDTKKVRIYGMLDFHCRG